MSKTQSVLLPIIVVWIVLTSILPHTTHGLSPVQHKNSKEWHDQSDAVFSGIIMDSKTIREEPGLGLAIVSVSIQVTRIWKGEITESTNVRYHGMPYSPYRREELLFYATGDKHALLIPFGGIFRIEPGEEGADHIKMLGPAAGPIGLEDSIVTTLEQNAEPATPSPPPTPEPEYPIQEPPRSAPVFEPEYTLHLTFFDIVKILFSPTRTFRVLTFIISRLFDSSTDTTVPNEEFHPSPPTPIDSPPIPRQTPVASPEPLQNKFETISHHDTAWYDLSRGDYVIQYAERWEEFWNEVHKTRSPVPNLPSINFDATMVLATVMGTRPTGGFAIEIVDVLEKEHSIEIIVQETLPDPNSSHTQAATNPYHIIAIGRTEKEIVFIR